MQRTLSRPRAGWSPGQATAPIHHRAAVTAADKLSVPGTITRSAVTEAGSTLANSAFNIAVAAYNRWGSSGIGTPPASLTPTLNQAIRLAFGQVTGADGYDIFLSTDANPKWVARITEAQRAAGGFIVSSVGTVTAGGGASAGAVDIGIAGTGLGANVNPFASNNAYLLSNATPINCSDYEYADIFVELAVGDLRSLPSLVLTGFEQVGSSPSDWCQFWTQTVSILTAVEQPLLQKFRVAVGGANAIAILVDSISGQNPSCDIYVDLE